MADDYSAIATPVSDKDDYSSIADPVPTSGVFSDTVQRLGENLWKGLGSMEAGLDRLEQRFSPDTYNENMRRKRRSAYETAKRTGQPYKAPRPAGESLREIADTGSRRTDPARDEGLPALAANIVGTAAPAFLLGPLAPVGLGATLSDEEKRRAVAEGDSPEVAQARGDLAFSAGTAAGVLPIPGKRVVTKALTGAAGNIAGDIAIEKVQGRDVDGKQLLQSGGIGLLFGAGLGLKDRAAMPKVAPKGPSIVTQMDGATHGTPSQANVAANEIAMKPIEPVSQVAAPEAPVAQPTPAIAPESAPAAITAESVAKMTPDEFNEFQINKNVTEEAKRAGELATTKEQIAYLAEQGKLANAEAKRLVAEKDFDSLQKVMTREQFFNEAHQAATKSMPFATDSLKAVGEVDPTKTKTQLIKEIKEKNPGADIEAPRQLLNKGKYEVRDVFLDEIGPVFGEKTVQPEVVARYVKNPSSDPIILAEVDGELRPVDGKHRLTAAQQRGDETIKAWVPVETQTGKALPKFYLPDSYAKIADPLEPAAEAFALPKELTKSNPRYSYGQNKFEVKFDSELDKALYILAGEKKSAADGKFLKLVMDHTGMTEAEARTAGRTVRDELKMMAKEGSDGEVLTVPTINESAIAQLPQAKPVVAVSKPKVAAVPVETTAVEPFVSTPEVQKAVDDAEVAQITAPPPAPPIKPPVTASGMPQPAPKGPQPGAYKPGLTNMGLGLGKAAEFAKVAVGTIEGNIRDANKKLFGTLRNYEYDKSQLSLKLEEMTMPASRLARKILSDEGNDVVGNLLMSGKVQEAKDLVAKDTRYGPQFAKAIDDVRSALDYTHELNKQVRGEENAPYIKDYFPRQLISYADFRKFLGKAEQSTADAAIRRAQENSKTPLTQEQVEAALNNLVSQSRLNGGKPGYLKARTINEIDANISKFYEPWDVALENHLRRATNDVVNRSYFGKAADGAEWNPEGGSFGKVIADEIAAGRLLGKAQDIVIDNLQDRFKMEHAASGIMADIGRKIRFAQSAAYLGQVQTAVAQFGDVFGSILHQGPLDTARGYGNRRIKLRDIGIHEGNVETAQFSRNKGLVDKAADMTIKFGVGLSDQFNKGGVANAIARHYADVMKNPNSDAFKKLSTNYSKKFPEQWPAMQKELQTKAFADGKIKELPMAQFFLYNEMADIHPINPSGMAQGFNAAHPLAKPFWGLKSYMIKQLDIMRSRGYEKLKDPRTRNEGLAYLASYAAIVAAGQNFAVSWLRDKLADRETDTSDYFVGGFLQPLGISRYTIMQVKKGEVGKAIVETLLPIVSLGKEVINDVGLTRDMLMGRRDKKTRQRTVKDLGDLVSQSETVKHFPVLGSLYYSRAGKGREKELDRRENKAKGQAQPNTLETISDIFVPEEKASR